MRRGGSRPFLVIPAKARYPGLEHYRLGRNRFSVALPGLDPGIHVFLYRGANQDVDPPGQARLCRAVQVRFGRLRNRVLHVAADREQQLERAGEAAEDYVWQLGVAIGPARAPGFGAVKALAQS
jgi:hypothetical protein